MEAGQNFTLAICGSSRLEHYILSLVMSLFLFLWMCLCGLERYASRTLYIFMWISAVNYVYADFPCGRPQLCDCLSSVSQVVCAGKDIRYVPYFPDIGSYHLLNLRHNRIAFIPPRILQQFYNVDVRDNKYFSCQRKSQMPMWMQRRILSDCKDGPHTILPSVFYPSVEKRVSSSLPLQIGYETEKDFAASPKTVYELPGVPDPVYTDMEPGDVYFDDNRDGLPEPSQAPDDALTLWNIKVPTSILPSVFMTPEGKLKMPDVPPDFPFAEFFNKYFDKTVMLMVSVPAGMILVGCAALCCWCTKCGRRCLDSVFCCRWRSCCSHRRRHRNGADPWGSSSSFYEMGSCDSSVSGPGDSSTGGVVPHAVSSMCGPSREYKSE